MLEISQMTLTKDNYNDLKEIVSRYYAVKKEYKNQKHKLQEIYHNHNNQNNSFSWFGNNQKDNNINDVSVIENQCKVLRLQKNELKFQVYSIVKKMIANNPDYVEIYAKYLNYIAENKEELQQHKLNLKLVQRKGEIDRFFNTLKDKLEKNIVLSETEKKQYIEKYKEISSFLEELYLKKSNGYLYKKEKSHANSLEFSDLNLDDVFIVLSRITLLYNIVINPVYNDYKDMYITYRNRYEFIKKYNERIKELVSSVLKMKVSMDDL